LSLADCPARERWTQAQQSEAGARRRKSFVTSRSFSLPLQHTLRAFATLMLGKQFGMAVMLTQINAA
jgi:hypothetical protein